MRSTDMAQRVRKAVLPVAGLGTRFLPATKAMPKEMLTVDDREHFLGHRLGRRQEARAEAGNRQDGFTNALGHIGRPHSPAAYSASKSMVWPRRAAAVDATARP